DERAFEIEAEGLSAVVGRTRDPGPDAVGKGVELRHRRGPRRREERGYALAEQGPGHAVEVLHGTHRRVAAPAMDVDVDESRSQVRQAGRSIDCRGSVVELHRNDRVVLDRDDAWRDAALEDEAPAELGSVGGHAGSLGGGRA